MLPDPETCRRLAVDVAPRWVFLPGMLAAFPNGSKWRINHPAELDANALPDLTDPLTAAGAELVLNAIDPDVEVNRYQGAWSATRPPVKGAPGLEGLLRRIVARGTTKLECTIAAILVAPEP